MLLENIAIIMLGTFLGNILFLVTQILLNLGIMKYQNFLVRKHLASMLEQKDKDSHLTVVKD